MANYHIPVLLSQSVDALNIKSGGIYVDVTFGGGGHSREILSRLKGGKLIVFDRDEDAKQNLPDDERVIFVHNNFRFLYNFLRYNSISKVDGVLADLGVSSHHFDEKQRGFSFRFTNVDLDMRMNKESSLNAKKVLNTYSSESLVKIFKEYGEIQNADRITQAILEYRESKSFVTIKDLIDSINPFIPKLGDKQFLAKVFQAIRIEVNREIEALKHFLLQTVQVLNPGGRLVVISYHSLEDRLVKNFIKTGNIDGIVQKDFYGNKITPFKIITKKAITPTEEEIINNSRARSAKLRVAELV